jgi:hypothetical protein
MIDAELLIKTLLDRDTPEGVLILPAIDGIEYPGVFPLMTFAVSVGQAIDNHAPPAGWEATLDLNIIDDDLDDAKALAFAVYDAVWAWADPFSPSVGIVANVGSVNDVGDNSIFTRVSTVEVESKWVTQYAGSFGLTLRPPH